MRGKATPVILTQDYKPAVYPLSLSPLVQDGTILDPFDDRAILALRSRLSERFRFPVSDSHFPMSDVILFNHF